MFNNKEQIKVSQAEKFLSRENCKLKLEVGRRVTIIYSFFFPYERRDEVLNTVNLINETHITSEMKYNIIETSTKEQTIVKLELILEFENCLAKGNDCFLDISRRFIYIKTILDRYAEEKMAKSFKLSCLFFAKNLQRDNKKEMNKQGVEIHNDLLLLGHYSKYTENVNYEVCVFKHDVHFTAYSGNVNRDFVEIYYEIVNELLDLNDNCIC